MTRRTIGGALDIAALSLLHFHPLDTREQAATVRRMAAIGKGDCAIAGTTGLSVEFVRGILAQSREVTP